MSQLGGNLQKQVEEFTNKMNETIQMAHSMLEDQLKNHVDDLPDEIKQQLADLKKKMGNNGHSN